MARRVPVVEFALPSSPFRSPALLSAAGLLVLLALAPATALGGVPRSAKPVAAVTGKPDAGGGRSRPKTCHRGKHRRCPPRRISPPLPPPIGAALGAATVTGSSATLLGQVNPSGRATTYWFEYGTNTGYGTRTGAFKAGAGWQSRSVSGSLPSLAPLTTYHFRVTATACNGCRKGTFHSDDATFTTGGYLNAVYRDPAPDPFVLDGAGTHNDYWSFATGDRFPMLRSSDLVHWTTAGTAMTARPAWVLQSGDWHPWAPHVVNTAAPCPGTSSPSCYAMYYVGMSARFSVNCVAVATATAPGGPYTDRGPLSNGSLDAAGRPIGCGDDQGYGMIDPSVFVDPGDGRHYLYSSEDFKCPPAASSCTSANSTLTPTISVIPLSGDFLTAAGSRTPLFTGDPGGWEAADVAAPTVEAPAAVFHNGTYYVLYSGGSWRSRYGMGYATAPGPTGPFTKSAANPILAQTATVVGPGGGDTPVAGPHGGNWLVYHGRDGSNTNPRALRIDPFSWQPTGSGLDAPVIGGPSSTPQAAQP